MEAVAKILKSRYIRLKALPDGAALEKVVAWAVHDYCAIRPHTSLHGLTPDEAYCGVKVESLRFAENVEAARKARIQRNRQSFCKADC